MKRGLRVALLLLVLAAGVLTLAHSYAFKWSRPSFAARYFTAELSGKYATAEAAFAHFDAALVNHDASLYEEVLGRPVTPEEARGFGSAAAPAGSSKVVRRETRPGIVYLVTDANAGEFFEFFDGRWVFTPEDWAANLRLFFRSLGL